MNYFRLQFNIICFNVIYIYLSGEIAHGFSKFNAFSLHHVKIMSHGHYYDYHTTLPHYWSLYHPID